MSQNEVLVKAAEALRDLVKAKEELEKQSGLYRECIKVAFELANRGQIDRSPESIIKKAEELSSNSQELPIIKKAMEMTIDYENWGVGSLEKKGSKEGQPNSAEEQFWMILKGN